MPQNPPKDTPRISPYLYYEDVAAAMEWLAKAFGFEDHMRITGEDGQITHAEMRLADGVIMMGYPGPAYRCPKRLGERTQCLHVYVDDVDAHFARAQAAGAEIVEEPADQFYGDRRYGADDPEGHRWYFAQHVKDVDPAEFGATEGAK